MMKIKKMLGHKTLRCTYTVTSSRGQELHSSYNLLEQTLFNACATCELFDGTLNNPFICLGLGEKKAQKHIHRSQENHIKF